MTEHKIPEGAVLRDDGCICPPEAQEEEAKKVIEKKKISLSTCPYDPRFPNQNTTRRCYLSFVDYQRCARLLGNYKGCDYFLKCYRALCPLAWQEKWFNQMENNTFPRKIYPPKPIIYPPKQSMSGEGEEDEQEEDEEEHDVC